MPTSPARRPLNPTSRRGWLKVVMVIGLLIAAYQALIYPALTNQNHPPSYPGDCPFVYRVPPGLPNGSRPVLQDIAREFHDSYHRLGIRESQLAIQDRLAKNHRERYGRSHLMAGDLVEDCRNRP